MMKVPRTLALSLWMACLALRLCLPAWDVCWHRDGQVCNEVVPGSCCDGGQRDPEPVDEDCADCTDLRIEPIGSGGGSPPSALVPAADAAVEAVALPLMLSERERYRGADAGAGPPSRTLSIPLRC